MGREATRAPFFLRVFDMVGQRIFCLGIFWGLLAVLTGGCCDKEGLPRMKHSLYSQKSSERNEAALGLARCGTYAKDVVPRLISMLYDENVGVQSSAAYALREIDTPQARRALEQAQALREKRRQQR